MQEEKEMLVSKLAAVKKSAVRLHLATRSIYDGFKASLNSTKEWALKSMVAAKGMFQSMSKLLQSERERCLIREKDYSANSVKLSNQIKCLQAELESTRNERSMQSETNLKQAQNESARTIEHLRAELERANNEANGLRDHLQKAVMAAENYQNKLQALKEKQKSNSKSPSSNNKAENYYLAEIERIKQAHLEEIEEIQLQFAQRVNEEVMKELEKELKQMEEQQELINSQYEESRIADEQKSRFILTLKDELSTLKSEFITVNEVNSELRRELTAKEAECFRLSNQIAEFKKAEKNRPSISEEAKQRIVALEASLADSQEKLLQLKNIKLSLKKKLKEKKEAERDFQKLKDTIEMRLSQSEQKHAELSSHLSRVEFDKSKALQKLEEVSSKAEKALVKMRDKLSALQAQLIKEKTGRALLEEQNAELASRLAKIDKGPKTVSDLQSKISLLQNEQRQLKKQMMDSFVGKI